MSRLNRRAKITVVTYAWESELKCSFTAAIEDLSSIAARAISTKKNRSLGPKREFIAPSEGNGLNIFIVATANPNEKIIQVIPTKTPSLDIKRIQRS